MFIQYPEGSTCPKCGSLRTLRGLTWVCLNTLGADEEPACGFSEALGASEVEATINPGVMRTVSWLRAHLFNTTDSGDGETNVKAGMFDALPFPHVFMLVQHPSTRMLGFALIMEAERLADLVRPIPCAIVEAIFAPLDARGRRRSPRDPQVRNSQTQAILMLRNVDDKMLEAYIKS